MKTTVKHPLANFLLLALISILFSGCGQNGEPTITEGSYKILFLHHSTGMKIWNGKTGSFEKINRLFGAQYAVPGWFEEYNTTAETQYVISERAFPSGDPYPWNNYPYDYYNIWVKNAGSEPYQEEPTLEMLTKEYDMIIFKHCFPVGKILPDEENLNIESPSKTLGNYKLQYEAIKNKLLEFPNVNFLIWTGAALVEGKTTPDQATRTREFFNWVKTEWDAEGDNIYLWDFYELETEGGLYLKNDFAAGPSDSHPNGDFAEIAAPLFCQRIVDIIETKGSKTSLTGTIE